MDKTVKKKKKAGKIRLVILVVLLFLVPLAVVGVILALNADDNLNNGTITAVTMDFDGETWDVAEEEDVRFFTDVVQGGSVIDESATPLDEYRRLRLTFHKLKTDVSYELFLSDSVNDCLYTDPEGKLFLIAPEKAQELLVHPRITGLAMSFATPPTCALSVNGVPTDTYAGEWIYTKVDGNLTTVSPQETGEQNAVLPAGEALAFSFSLQPDFVRIRVADEKDAVLFAGDPDEMELLSFEDDTTLSVSVSAEWYEAEGKSYRGNITYEFTVLYDVPSLCTLSREAVLPGEAFEIRVLHSDADELAVTATFQAGEITQYREGKELVIRVPVVPGVSPNDYEIVLLGVDVDETFPVTILQPEG